MARPRKMSPDKSGTFTLEEYLEWKKEWDFWSRFVSIMAPLDKPIKLVPKGKEKEGDNEHIVESL